MKKLITVILFLFTLTISAQEWQTEGTKYPNAVNVGDSLSTNALIPVWDSNKLQNYFADLGDLLALNPPPPTPTLQSVTDVGNWTTNAIQIIGTSGLDYSKNGLGLSGGDYARMEFINPEQVGGIGGLLHMAANNIQFAYLYGTNADDTRMTLREETPIEAGVDIDTRLSISDGINPQDAVTVNQLNASKIIPTLYEVVEAGNQVNGSDIFLYNGSSLYVGTRNTTDAAQNIRYGQTGMLYKESGIVKGSISFNVSPGNGTDSGINIISKNATGGSAIELYPEETTESAAVRFSKSGSTLKRRVSFAPAINDGEGVTLGQMRDSTAMFNITEGSSTGIGTLFRKNNPDKYGNIGNNAVDLSMNMGPDNDGETRGATGLLSFAAGFRNISSGIRSTAIGGSGNVASGFGSTVVGGVTSLASGDNSTTIGGSNIIAASGYETSLGIYNTNYTPADASGADLSDRLLSVGNGTSDTTKSDAFTILKNGQTGVGIDNFEANTTGEKLQVNGIIKSMASIVEIDGGSGNTVVTKDWVNSNISGAYGVEWNVNVAATEMTRIGDMDAHRELPVQSKMRRCLLADDGTVNYYLHPQTSTTRDDGSQATLDGTHGQVMVEIPRHWRKFETDGAIRRVWISLTPFKGAHEVPKMYVGAYKATLKRDTNTLSSVYNTTANYRGGNNQSEWDGTSRSQIRRPATVINRTNFREYAANRGEGWYPMLYQARKTIFWLMKVEFANKNDQLPFNSNPTEFATGGLGDGATTISNADWDTFNGYYPLIPVGLTNNQGNKSGEITFTIQDFPTSGSVKDIKVNSYRGVENFFGDIWEWTFGVNVKVDQNEAEAYIANGNKESDTDYLGYHVLDPLPLTNGYISILQFGEDGDILPVMGSGGGSATTYWSDQYYQNNPGSPGEILRAVRFGGAAGTGASAGSLCVNSLSVPSSAYSYTGSRLCYLP